MKNIMRTEHPKPQFERKNWINLNGKWQFEFDFGKSGVERKFFSDEMVFSKEIIVPFCPESKLSGIGYADFMPAVWYKREVKIDAESLKGRVFLHFGAVDYSAIVFVNGVECGRHKGGYVSFKFEITEFLREGNNQIAVYVEDDTRNDLIPSGKQSYPYKSSGIVYTRSTGIWQTVWLEFTPKNYIDSVKYYTDIEKGELTVFVRTKGNSKLTVQAMFNGADMGSVSHECVEGQTCVTLELKEKHLWEIGNGRLYDLILTYGEDRVKSYFGLRDIRMVGNKFLLNGKSVFQRLVLDQGYYPDGIYTAPSDEELEKDIDRALVLGFNGARLHQKIFEERFLYHCDKKGYMVWAEYPSWGLTLTDEVAVYSILSEWLEEIERDFNHPSIVAWCPFNETEKERKENILRLVYQTTKAVDTTRPCIDTSGWYHVDTDIFDVHDYEQDADKFAKKYQDLSVDQTFLLNGLFEQHYKLGKPICVSEFGGRFTLPNATEEGKANYYKYLKGLTDVLLDNPLMFGFCYTQLYDIEEELNGFYTYDRVQKFPSEKIKEIISRKAKIED